jgi:hypothetical protein
MEEKNKPIVDQYTPDLQPDFQIDPIKDMVEGIRSYMPSGPTNLDYIQSDIANEASVASLFSPTTGASFTGEKFRISDAYTRLNSGEYIPKYENFLPGVDNEHRLALQQTKANKWSRGWAKFFGKTGTAVLGGTIGTLVGLSEAIAEGDWEALYDNDFYEVMDDWNTRMDNGLSNYYTQEERDMGFFESMGTANFWANDFLGGLSFTAGAIVTEGIWAAATGGASLATTAARYTLRGANAVGKATRTGKVIKNATKPLKNYLSKVHGVKSAVNAGKFTQGLNTARYIYTSAGYEAGVEARAYMGEQRESFRINFEEMYGREPNASEIAAFEEGLSGTTNSVFATNMALVGSSNLAIFGKMFNITSPIKAPKTAFKKVLFGQGVTKTAEGVYRPIKRNVLQRTAGTSYSLLRAPFIEGVYEEGLQGVTATSAGAFLESSYDLNESTLGLIESVYEGLSHTYGTKEGFKEVGLGMLIGAFGGGAANLATGQNPFANTIDAAKRVSGRDENVAKVLNKYSSKKLAEEIFRANVIVNTNKEGEVAEEKDLAHREANRTMGMLANIIYAENLGFGDEVAGDFQTEVDNFSAEALAKNLGISVEDANELKKAAKEDYSSLRDTYVKNKEFADYIIGAGKIKDKKLNTEVARQMIAYQMTMAERAESLSEDFAKALMAEVGDTNSYNTRISKFIEIQNTLRKATREDKAKFRVLQKRYKKAERKLKALEKQRLTQQSRLNSTKEDNQNLAGQLNNTTQEIAETTKELAAVENQFEQAYAAMATYGIQPTSEGIVSGRDLANIEENLAAVEEFFNKTERTNPEKAARIEAIIRGYRAAIQQSKSFGEVIEDLMNPQTGLKGTTRTFINKIKEYNDPTERLVKNLTKQQAIFASESAPMFAEEQKEKVTEEQAEVTSDIAEDIETTPETTEAAKPTVAKETPTSKINLQISKLLGSNNYALQNFGEDPSAVRPTKKDVSTYEALLEKMKFNPDTLIGKDADKISSSALKRWNLTRAEVKEFQALNRKLSDWRVMDGVEVNGVSLTDLVNQKNAYKAETKDKGVDNLTEAEEMEVSVGVKNESNRAMSSEMVNTQENVMAVKTKGNTELAHLGLGYLNDQGWTIKKGGKEVEDFGAPATGAYTISKDGQTIPIKVTRHNRISVRDKNLSDFLEATGMAIVSVKGVGGYWKPVYIKGEDGNYSPMPSKFTINEAGSDINILDPQSLFELNPGDQLFFKVSINDSYNKKLEEEYHEAYWAFDADPSMKNKERLEAVEQKILQESHIYVVNSNGDVVGQVKAMDADVQSVGNFAAIRNYASKVLLNRYNPDTPVVTVPKNLVTNETGNYNKGVSQTVYTLPFTTTVENVYAGTPSLNVAVENGAATIIRQDFNDETIEVVEGFGIVEGGELIFSKGNKVDLSTINTQFVSKIKKATPFVVISHKGKPIAYPINIKPGASDAVASVQRIYGSNMSMGEKAEALISTLKEFGINPNDYNVRHIDAEDTFFESEDEIRLLSDISEENFSISRDKFLSSQYTREDLKRDGQIGVDLADKPFQNPKVKINLRDEMLYTEEAQQEEVARFEITGVAEDITLESISNKVVAGDKEGLSTFHKKVYNAYQKEVDKRVDEKLKLSEERARQSKEERNKEC